MSDGAIDLKAEARAKAYAMPLEEINVADPDLFRTDTMWPYFERLRKEDPVHYNATGHEDGPYWSVTKYNDIMSVDTNHEVYSSEPSITIFDPKEDFTMPMFIAMDPPKHDIQRKTVSPIVSPANLHELEPLIRQRICATLDALPIGEEFDWVDKVSIELTTQMLATLFDFPWEERHRLTGWSDALGDIESFDTLEKRQVRLAKAFEMGAAFKQLWDAKAQNPGKHDLISIMLQSDAMKHMSENEFMGNLILLIVGGNDTTRNSMSAYAYGLHSFPEERAKLEKNHDPELAINAMHEILRWQTPLAHMRRTATEDTELFGHEIKKRDKLALWYASANRDESVFPDGDRIIVDRENARRHLAFGYGIHRCVGARVAELQLTTLISEMQRRRLRVNVLAEPERVHASFVHGYRHMPVQLEKY